MPQTYLMLLWHQHQPFYKDLSDNRYAMPWVRLHALKDYYGMVAVLREFPEFHATFNLVPSLIEQIEDYTAGRAQEDAYDLAFKPAADLEPDERARLADCAFQLNRENLLYRYPRFRELYRKVRPWQAGPVCLATAEELRDLQVLSQLAWFDEIYLTSDPVIRELTTRGRGYTEEDKSLLFSKESELLNAVLEEHRAAEERGQVELSTSAFYHPIVPLLCDTNVAAESHRGVSLPAQRFCHPEDAKAQLQRAVELHARLFGRRPRGWWPSEGAVSDEALMLAAGEGFEWAASDEAVLARSRDVIFSRQLNGTVAGGGELYRPYRLERDGRSIVLFFRDHEISDRIGFVYSRMEPRQAAQDLHERIRAAGRSTGSRPAIVSVILDGENAWEYFPANGREFLKLFYGSIVRDPEIHAVTASEALAAAEPAVLSHIVPGSWINANFDVWIGADEDNRAWDLLGAARDFFAANAARRSAHDAELAQQEIWVAEGSDWCWWYGPEHSTPNDEEFDRLYRQHLSNVYRFLGASPPDALAEPIKRPRAEALHVPPTGRIEPIIDGKVTSYFEWLGAGVYSPAERSGTMHGPTPGVDVLYYGYSDRALYLRLDLNRLFLQTHPDFEIRILTAGNRRLRISTRVSGGHVASLEVWPGAEAAPGEPPEGVQAAFDRVLEIAISQDAAVATTEHDLEVQVSVWARDLPVQIVPQQGSLRIKLTSDLAGW